MRAQGKLYWSLGVIWLKMENEMRQVHEPIIKNAITALESYRLLWLHSLYFLNSLCLPWLFIHLIHKYLFNVQYVPGTALCSDYATLNKTDLFLPFLGLQCDRVTPCRLRVGNHYLPYHACVEEPTASCLLRTHHEDRSGSRVCKS